MQQRKSKTTLSMQLVLLVLACWVLPVLLVMGIMGATIGKNINQQIAQNCQNATEVSANFCRVNLESAVRASRESTYNKTIANAYARYNQFDHKTQLYQAVTGYLSAQYKYDNNFLSTVLFFCDRPDTLYYTYSNNDSRASYQRIVRYQKSVHAQVRNLSKTLDSDIAFLNVDGNAYMVRNLLDTSFTPYAVLIMELNRAQMFGSLQSIPWAASASVSLNGTRYDVFGIPPQNDTFARLSRGSDKQFEDKSNTVLLYGRQRVSDVQFVHTVLVNKDALSDSLFGFRTTQLYVVLLVIPFLLLMLWGVYASISRPITQLVGALHAIDAGELGYQMQNTASSREFSYLNESFNKMSAKIKHQFERIYSEELALRDAKIMALQSQINPHFLNNTLEIINWEARLEGNVKVSKMIESLSTMLDAAMDRKGRPLVPLWQEVQYVDAYLYIISVRLGKRLQVQKEIDNTLLNCALPRLILQPIVENAVEHGIKQKGTITLSARKEGDLLALRIQNDGERLTQADLQRIHAMLTQDNTTLTHSGHLGIYNVDARLKILYGPHSGLHFYVNPTGHTVVKILIPLSQIPSAPDEYKPNPLESVRNGSGGD